MNDKKAFDVPILLIVFNRTDTTERLLQALAEIRPARIFVSADGARTNRAGEAELCEQVRALIESKINWPCEVRKKFNDRNLGCRAAVSSAIDWFFSEVEEGIILEDDTLPDPSFFPYCRELLERYREDERVHMISGDNFQEGARRSEDSYYFSNFAHIWGWATWRRAWRDYDVNTAAWPEFLQSGRLKNFVQSFRGRVFWESFLEGVHTKRADTWDAQWAFTAWLHDRVCILPAVNLISNIGFGDMATHTTHDSPFANLPRHELEFPLRHPAQIQVHAEADRFTEERMFRAGLKSILKFFWSRVPPGSRSFRGIT